MGIFRSGLCCLFQKIYNLPCIVAKKWDPGILDPSRFSGKIRKVEARLGKLAKIRKVETDKEKSTKRLGKLEVRPKKKRSSPIFGLEIRKV